MKISSLSWSLLLPVITFTFLPNASRKAADHTQPSVLAALRAVMAQAQTATTQASTPFVSKDGRFSITLPPASAEFDHTRNTQTTPAGDIEVNMHRSTTAKGVCIVAYADYPAKVFEHDTSQTILERGRDGALKSVNATLEKQESVLVQGHPGLTFYSSLVSKENTIYVRWDYVVVPPRVYQVGFLTLEKANLDSPEALAFFQSFHLD